MLVTSLCFIAILFLVTHTLLFIKGWVWRYQQHIWLTVHLKNYRLYVERLEKEDPERLAEELEDTAFRLALTLPLICPPVKVINTLKNIAVYNMAELSFDRNLFNYIKNEEWEI